MKELTAGEILGRKLTCSPFIPHGLGLRIEVQFSFSLGNEMQQREDLCMARFILFFNEHETNCTSILIFILCDKIIPPPEDSSLLCLGSGPEIRVSRVTVNSLFFLVSRVSLIHRDNFGLRN